MRWTILPLAAVLVSVQSFSTVRVSKAPSFPLTQLTRRTDARCDVRQWAASTDMEAKISGRKKRVSLGYRITTLGYFVAATVALKKYGVTPFSSYTVAGPLMAAAISHVQISAVKNDRLDSPTYKRLNLLGAKYGGLGLVIAALAPQTANPFWWAFTMLSVITAINSTKGFAYGVKGWDLPGGKLEGLFREIKKQPISLLLIMDPEVSLLRPRLTTLSYYLATVFSGCLKIAKLWEIFSLVVAGAPTTHIASRISRYGKLTLMTIISLTLKDAADRRRFDGSTFVELNLAMSLAYGSLSWYLQSVEAPKYMVGATAFFGATCIYHGLAGALGKVFK